MNKAVFLDRDGVINKTIIIDGKSYAPRLLKDFKIFPKVKSEVKKLKNNGFKVFVITNQPDIGNKLLKKKTPNEMHSLLKTKVSIDKIYYCPHTRSDRCKCRKPKNKMILDIMKTHEVNLDKSCMIGDKKIDEICAKKSNLKFFYPNKNFNTLVKNILNI